jgi:Protein of unknown function (DUF3102)
MERRRLNRLPNLAAQINAAHVAAIDATLNAFECWVKAGELLIKAKSRVKHGKWEDWVENNLVNLSLRQAQKYMQVAKGRAELEAKTPPTALFNLDKAVALLAAPVPRKDPDPDPDQDDEEEPDDEGDEEDDEDEPKPDPGPPPRPFPTPAPNPKTELLTELRPLVEQLEALSVRDSVPGSEIARIAARIRELLTPVQVH